MSNFINPIPNSYLTSPFGWRTHPVTGQKQSWHQGIDLAIKPNSNVKVLASADGIVHQYISDKTTYGNVLFIEHKINGKRMDTTYAHLASKNVKAGQKVKQGDVIGIMGNTGSSTAPHLHFEIHNGPWVSGQLNAVDPMLYIDKESEEDKMIKELQKQVAELTAIVDSLVKNANKQYTRTIPSSWAKDDISYAKLHGISDGTRLDGLITREEAIALAVRVDKRKQGVK